MPRRTDISTTISCSTALLWQAVYADSRPAQVYHAQVNQDHAAQVAAWQEGVRHVTFCMPLNAPDWVKRMANIETVRVRETQVVLWHSARSFTVRSETQVLNVPGAARFSTTLSLTATEKGGGSADGPAVFCEVVFSVKCAAGLPWPLCASIENIMTEKAQASMQGYLDFCQALVDAALNNAAGAAEPGTAEQGRVSSTAGVGTVFNAMAAAVGAPQLASARDTDVQEAGTAASRPEGAAGQGGRRAGGSKRASAAGAGALAERAGLEEADLERAASSLLTGRTSFRWPSVAVSTYPQDLDDMLPPLPESARADAPASTAAEIAAGQGRPEGEGAENGDGDLQSANERWLSPTNSFSASGYASDGEHPPRFTNQLHSLQGVYAASDLTQATLAAALQSLATAVQALERKVTLIASHLPQHPLQATTTHAAGAANHQGAQHREGTAATWWWSRNHTGLDDTGYQPLLAPEDVEAGQLPASASRKPARGCCWRLVSWALSVMLLAVAGVGMYWLVLVLIHGPHGTGYLPQPPPPPAPAYPPPPQAWSF